jgi:putative ABC transport system permease protein
MIALSVIGLILREIRHRLGGFLLASTAVATAGTLFVAAELSLEAHSRETRKVLLGLGRNLRIVHASTTPEELWLDGRVREWLPENALDRLAERQAISYNRLVGKLERRVSIAGHEAIITGLSDERFPPGEKRPSLAYRMAPNTVSLGYWIAERLGARKGDSIEILGQPFEVSAVLSSDATIGREAGSDQDLRVFCRLDDAQRLLEAPGKLTEIEAIDCILCEPWTGDPIAKLREEIESAVPEARVIVRSQIADVRSRERRAVEGFASAALLFAFAVSALFIGTLAWINARERRTEIGLLRALGKPPVFVFGLILGRALVVGSLGAVIGCIAGCATGLVVSSRVFPEAGPGLTVLDAPLLETILGAPLLAVLASAVPAVAASTRDPVESLRVP